MEEIISRFPHIGEAFFKELDGKNFCNLASLRRRGHFLPSNRSLRKPKGAVGIAFNRPTNEPDNFKEFYWIVRRQDSKP